MALDPLELSTPLTPSWWMAQMAAALLDRNRIVRLATLDAYLRGCPPLPQLSASDRRGYYRFLAVSRTNMARKVTSSVGTRMAVRAIRTAATEDDRGDEVAWRYWTRNGLDLASTDVHTDMLAFSEGYVRVGLDSDGQPVALKRDPRFCITVQDPLNPLNTAAAFELLWDQVRGEMYAYLWLPGQQWVASAPMTIAPRNVSIRGISTDAARRFGWWWPQLSFDAGQFTMRPDIADVPESERDGGPYCQAIPAGAVPVVRFDNRDGVGEFEEHLDVIDRIMQTVLHRVITTAVQAYKQRALQQDIPSSGQVVDRVPATNPKTGEPIDWASLMEPGPDALWKLPPGVKIWESTETDLKPLLAAAQDDIKTLSAVTDTPIPLLSDDVNQSAEGAQFRREGHVFKVEDRDRIAGRRWAQVMALLFLFAPDADRYSGDGETRIDRADAGSIVIDWFPAERFSLAEKSQADSQNKTLSIDMAAAKIWQLTPDEVALNRDQRKSDAELPIQYRVSDLPFDPNAPQPPTPAPTAA